MTQIIEARDKSDICAMHIFLIIILISSKQKKIDTKIVKKIICITKRSISWKNHLWMTFCGDVQKMKTNIIQYYLKYKLINLSLNIVDKICRFISLILYKNPYSHASSFVTSIVWSSKVRIGSMTDILSHFCKGNSPRRAKQTKIKANSWSC